ncbi:hemolysin XhlA family protein [Metabacillus idriensis]|uniref:hemolysin XhlA family protein n=1 Tax=Metabacillus idriensis TaxID=324768 RepID=UPI00174A9BEA|nr:hemolysin XhlA family protein [Metabacillus idriensis]MCM3599017.1 hemolysin XhlA family protein [Metabacillus idriensis]
MDLWKQSIQKEIDDLKSQSEKTKKEIDQLKQVTAFHERDIKDIKETLRDIKEDTKWLRRSITNAIIVAAIGGVIAIVFTALKGGI